MGQGKVRDTENKKKAICADMTVLYMGVYGSAAVAACLPSRKCTGLISN